jgi:hypothetical protein
MWRFQQLRLYSRTLKGKACGASESGFWELTRGRQTDAANHLVRLLPMCYLEGPDVIGENESILRPD